LHHPDLWHRTRSYPLIFERVIAPKVRPVYEFISRAYLPGKTIVVASNLALGARLAFEKLRMPFASMYVSPMCFRSYLHPPPFPGLDLFPGRPHAWVHLLFKIADRKVDRLLGPSLNSLGRELGLPPVRKVMDWWHSPQLVIGLFPEWFASLEPEWPSQTKLTGFPLYDTADSTGLPADVAEFLGAGPPPVVFMPSSFMAQSGSFLRESVEACRLQGCRGILLTQFAEQVPRPLAETIRSFRFVPLSTLLRHSSAIVHQGGIGTIAQALAAGVPQLAVPNAMDQHANAERLKKLGAGVVLNAGAYRARRVAREITEMLAKAEIHAACRRIVKLFDHGGSVASACDLIETLVNRD
jgi:UDP:flavonoid glycosyltransferase YjiC (YdhE family)